MTTPVSPYLLLFRDSSADSYKTLSAEDRQKLLSQWNAWYDGLAAEGKVQHGHPLEPTGRVVSASGGRVIDGPYAEAKEAVGGYFFLNVSSLEEATDIARQCPSLHWGLGLTVEVRPVAAMCPVLSAQQKAASEYARV
jgi:hypothetical protein